MYLLSDDHYGSQSYNLFVNDRRLRELLNCSIRTSCPSRPLVFHAAEGLGSPQRGVHVFTLKAFCTRIYHTNSVLPTYGTGCGNYADHVTVGSKYSCPALHDAL